MPSQDGLTPMSGPLLVARADATNHTGAGHAMRCLGVLERWIDSGGRAELWGTIEIGFVRRRAERVGVPIVAAPGNGAAVLLVDVYDPTERTTLGLERTVSVRVLVEDFREDIPPGYSAVWNPNAYAAASDYSDFAGRVLAGQEFVPVQEGLPAWVGGGAGAVSFGAMRLSDRLASVMGALPAACGVSSLQCVATSLPARCRPVPADDVWSTLKYAPWLISAVGSTTWEAAVVGIPFVGVIAADNHVVAARWVASHGVPVVDLRPEGSPEDAATALAVAVKQARPLPRLHPGARAVVREVRSLIGWTS